jgi:hypothetical protein
MLLLTLIWKEICSFLLFDQETGNCVRIPNKERLQNMPKSCVIFITYFSQIIFELLWNFETTGFWDEIFEVFF